MLLVFVILTFLFNVFWLQGLFNNDIFLVINEGHESFFSPSPSLHVSPIVKIVGMWGFWRENAYTSSYNLFPLWVFYAMLFALVALLLIGYISDKDNKKSSIFFTLWWVGIILGVGISHPYTGKFFDILFEYLPFFNGFRDSHKFVSLVVLGYAYFIPMAIRYTYKKKKGYVLASCLIIILLFAYTIPLFNIPKQVKPISYPQSYYETNDFLNDLNKNNSINGYVIYFPWQNYLTYTYTLNSSSDGRISVPINKVIDYRVLQGSDKYGTETPLIRAIRICLEIKDVKCLEENGVQYVLNDKCAVFSNKYEFINNTNSILVKQTSCIDVYKISNKKDASYEKLPLRFLSGILITLISLVSVSLIVSLALKKVKT